MIIAVPHTSQTNQLIGEKELNLLGKNALIINLSRGNVIEEEALFIALKNKNIAGAAIDVWYEYKPEADENGKKYPYHFPFHELDNIVLSPHRAASPFNDFTRWNEVFENIKRFVNGTKNYINVVDFEREY